MKRGSIKIMTPYIFPGLKPPTSKLAADIHAMINSSGGRLRLADILECEMVKTYHTNTRIFTGLWSNTETELLIDSYKKTDINGLMMLINRSKFSINSKICDLIEKGVLTIKTKRRKK